MSLILFASLLPIAGALQCYNCVGSDCDGAPNSGNSWELVTCAVGAICQKTQFSFYSNVKNESLKTYAVRSCSYETGCQESDSGKCSNSVRRLAGTGCPATYCCARDKCNSGASATISLILAAIIFFSI